MIKSANVDIHIIDILIHTQTCKRLDVNIVNVMYSWKGRKMDPTPIYTITTIRPAAHQSHRAVGFYYTFSDADLAVRENACDIYECGYYPYAVIEPVTEGIYCHPRKENWYKWNRLKKAYEPCEKPARFKQIIGWSLG